MSNFSASIPVDLVKQANAFLEERGHGGGNFSIPASSDGVYATHAGFHAWHDPRFRAAVQEMQDSGLFPGLVVTDAFTVDEEQKETLVEGNGEPNFAKHCEKRAIQWVDQTDKWQQNPIMKGDQRTIDGKLWTSLMDYNVWKPPVGWREVVATGYPAWVQPTGAHDAYKMGDKVSFKAKNYESVINANVWAPDVYPAGWKQIA